MAATLVAGCVQGEAVQIPFTAPNGITSVIVAHNQDVPDWLLRTSGLKMNYIVRAGDKTPGLQKFIADAEVACQEYTSVVRPNEFVAIAINGVVYALAGAAGGALGSQAFAGTAGMIGEYAQYTGSVYGMGGIANGIVQGGGKTYTFENCLRELVTRPGYEEYSISVLTKSPY
ncbi:MAG: hypothetical protein WAV21_03275 [Minisyncoccia bacterium]